MLSAAELAAYRAALEDTLSDTLDVVRVAGPGFVSLAPGAPSESTAHAGVPCNVAPLPAQRAGEIPVAGGAKVLATHVVRVAVGTDISPATDVLAWNGRRLRVALLNDRTSPLLDVYTCGEVR